MFVHGKYFYGNEISKYGQEHGYVDYRTFASSFGHVLNNSIIEETTKIGLFDWVQISGFYPTDEIEALHERLEELEEQDEAEDEIERIQERIEELEEEQEEYQYSEIFQYYIVSDSGVEILQEANEIVFYNETLDMNVWGVTHYGTSWDYVLTDIRCNVPYEDET